MDMIYTFSPNWYKPQCLHFRDNSMYYCSNYLLYHYDLSLKTVSNQLCFRQIALDHKLNHRDIKICSISSNQHSILVGLNQPYLAVLCRETMTLQNLVHLQTFQSVEYIYPYTEGLFDVAVLCGRDGYFLKYKMQEEKSQLQKIQIKHKLNGIKAIYLVKEKHFAVFTRGTIHIYNQDFSQLLKNVDLANTETIYSVDCWTQMELVYFGFLTRGKQSHSITVFQFNFKEEFPLEFKKKVEEIGDNITRFDVNIYYPKKFADKLKKNPKASMTIKLLSPSNVIFTGKFGEIFTIDVTKVKDRSNLQIKPYSYQQNQDLAYMCWSDSHHYKEIYFIYSHKEKLYMISTDHNLTIWLKHQNFKNIKFLYSIKFLTAPVQYFFHSQTDPRTVFAMLKDSAIRSFTPLEEGSHQVNQYWKFSKKYKIKKSILHPSEDGVIGLASDCHRIQLYDIYEDRLMKLIQIGEQIINISFQFASIQQSIEELFKVELKEEKYQAVSHFPKEMENKTVLFVQTKNSVILVSNLAQKELKFMKGPRSKRLQRIHGNRYWDERLLLCSQYKNTQLDILLRLEGKTQSIKLQMNYQQGRVFFKVEPKSNNLDIISFKNNKLGIIRTTLHSESQSIIKINTEIVFQTVIDYICLNYEDDRVSVYCQKEDLIAIIGIERLKQERYQIGKPCDIIGVYHLDAKLESIIFYLKDCLILGTKDQSIKVVNYLQLEPYQPQKKTKNTVHLN